VRDSASESQGSKRDDALVLRSPQSGRFYQRPAPGEPQFVVAGGEIAEGTPVGLIEVMKTFTHVVYRASSSLPPRARLKRFIAGDGADVRQGDVLIEIEAI
jgi:biotin carboxyl carrier protein